MITRPGTTDAKIVQETLAANEYELPARLRKGSRVLDVGAHIGAFAKSCLDRGAYKVVCFEPDLENYRLLLQNLEGCSVQAIHAAVWASDDRAPALGLSPYGVTYPKVGVIDTADCSLVGGGAQQVATVSLDSVLRWLGPFEYAKVDAEGSEWPMLLTSSHLSKCPHWMVEYHQMWGPLGLHSSENPPDHMRVAGYPTFDVAALVHKFESLGFAVRTKSYAPLDNGILWADRR